MPQIYNESLPILSEIDRKKYSKRGETQQLWAILETVLSVSASRASRHVCSRYEQRGNTDYQRGSIISEEGELLRKICSIEKVLGTGQGKNCCDGPVRFEWRILELLGTVIASDQSSFNPISLPLITPSLSTESASKLNISMNESTTQCHQIAKLREWAGNKKKTRSLEIPVPEKTKNTVLLIINLHLLSEFTRVWLNAFLMITNWCGIIVSLFHYTTRA